MASLGARHADMPEAQDQPALAIAQILCLGLGISLGGDGSGRHVKVPVCAKGPERMVAVPDCRSTTTMIPPPLRNVEVAFVSSIFRMETVASPMGRNVA
jgi:hypothetical protein